MSQTSNALNLNTSGNSWGRIMTFFLLYLSEGIPTGVTQTTMIRHLKDQGIGEDQIGVFSALLYLPWSWKIFFAPVIDLVHWGEYGHRRNWIVGCQLIMSVTLLLPLLSGVHYGWMLLALIVLHNIFAAAQDVAIDGLACRILTQKEQSAAAGWMFAGAYLGQSLGGSGTLWLLPKVGIHGALSMSALAILCITVLVSIWLREPITRTTVSLPTQLREIGKSLFGTRVRTIAIVIALLPSGAMGLDMALGQNIANEKSFLSKDAAELNLAATILSAAGCILGGYLVRFARGDRMLCLFLLLPSIPTIFCGQLIRLYGLSTSVAPYFITLRLVHALLTGLMYGGRSALFMRFCDSPLPGTQFTFYMSLLNLGLSYTSLWQGFVSKNWGHGPTLLVDGLAGLLVIPFVLSLGREGPSPDPEPSQDPGFLNPSIMISERGGLDNQAKRE